jgi:protein-tyrosine phosphatase
VSLLEPREEGEFALAGESASSAASGLEFRSFPIPDRGVPNSRESVAELASQIVGALHAGKNVALHCRQGIGRSALIAAAALISSGQDPEAALQRIGRSRGLEVPETKAQRQWISDFSTWLAATRVAQPDAAADRLRRR